MRRNERKKNIFMMLAFAFLAVVLVLGTTACVAEEGDSEAMEEIQGTEEDVVAETEGEVATPGVSLSTDKEMYSPDEAVSVLFTVDETVSADAFVGMVAAGSVPESVDAADYLVTEKITDVLSGELKFTAPTEAGEYELRLIDGDEIVLTISLIVE